MRAWPAWGQAILAHPVPTHRHSYELVRSGRERRKRTANVLRVHNPHKKRGWPGCVVHHKISIHLFCRVRSVVLAGFTKPKLQHQTRTEQQGQALGPVLEDFFLLVRLQSLSQKDVTGHRNTHALKRESTAAACHSHGNVTMQTPGIRLGRAAIETNDVAVFPRKVSVLLSAVDHHDELRGCLVFHIP